MGNTENDFSRTASARGPKLPRETVKEVGKKLKASYQRMIEQPVPKRLLDLLNQLDQDAISDRTDLKNAQGALGPASTTSSNGSNGGRD